MGELKKISEKKPGVGRFFVVVLLFVITFLVLNLLIKKQSDSSKEANSIKLPSISLEKYFSGKILGEAKKAIFGDKIPIAGSGEVQSEPIAQPVENIQKQTDSLLESIKKLPADQFEAVQKQLLKEMCQDYCRSATGTGENGQQ